MGTVGGSKRRTTHSTRCPKGVLHSTQRFSVKRFRAVAISPGAAGCCGRIVATATPLRVSAISVRESQSRNFCSASALRGRRLVEPLGAAWTVLYGVRARSPCRLAGSSLPCSWLCLGADESSEIGHRLLRGRDRHRRGAGGIPRPAERVATRLEVLEEELSASVVNEPIACPSWVVFNSRNSTGTSPPACSRTNRP